MIEASPFEKNLYYFLVKMLVWHRCVNFLYSAWLGYLDIRKSIWNFGILVTFALCISTCAFL